MQIDPKMLTRLLSMDDEHLSALIRSVATEAGIDPSGITLNPKSIADIRQALGSASAEDLQQLGNLYQAYRQTPPKH